jgi:ABC-2 type transport system permease protein
MFYLSIFNDYLKTYIKTRLTYRFDFWIEIFSDLLFQAMNLFFILVVFQHTDLLGGWTRAEIIFIYGYFMIPYGIFSCFFNLWGFTDRYIIKGEMDRILTRPAYNLVQIILENVDPASLFGSLTGAMIMGYAWMQMDLSLTWYDPFVFLLLIFGSTMVYGGIYISLTAVSLFSDSKTGILPLMWNIQNYGRYPVNIYNKAIKILLTWILPFAFVGVYPAAFFLNKEISQGFALLTPIVGAIFLTVGVSLWNLGVRNYRGAGS